jgi:hypothetical protein
MESFVPRLSVTGGGQRWYAREVKENKSTTWMDDIGREVLEVMRVVFVLGNNYISPSLVCRVAQGARY